MKKILTILVCFISLSASAQAPLTLDTYSLASAKTIIIPTYDNLIKLQKADSVQFIVTMRKYHYQIDKTGGANFSADDAPDYIVEKDKFKVIFIFTVKTPYPQALGDEIRKRFPDAKHNTSNGTDNYTIETNDATDSYAQIISIDKKAYDGTENGGSIMVSDD